MNARQILIDTHAHIPPAAALEDLSAEDAERRLPGASHSVAEIVAHMAFWQDWFQQRCEATAAPIVAHAADGWPVVAAGSWPAVHERFLAGLERTAALATGDVERRLTPPIDFPPLANYTVREAIVHVAQHNAHHLGQIIVLRQMMGRWPPPSGSWTW
jgi:uncharacterized damage-inducible protein DinB